MMRLQPSTWFANMAQAALLLPGTKLSYYMMKSRAYVPTDARKQPGWKAVSIHVLALAKVASCGSGIDCRTYRAVREQ